MNRKSDSEIRTQVMRELKWDSRIGWADIGVINTITVAPKPVDPKELQQEIENALGRRAEREAERFRIDVHEGVVELFGRVHSWQEKRAVLGSISHAPGVSAVRDHLRIDPYF